MDTRTRTIAHWFTVIAAAALGVLSIAHVASAEQQTTIIGATAEETVPVESAIDRYDTAADLVAWGLDSDPAPVYRMQKVPCEPRADLFHTLTELKNAHHECQVPEAGYAQPVTVHADDDRNHQLVGSVLDLYQRAGLTVPATDVYFHSIRRPCRGFAGLRTTGAGWDRIDVCVQDLPKAEHTILHEFAHAWAADNLTDYQRDTFLAMRGLETWNDSDTVRRERGTEHAASIIAWGLNHQYRAPAIFGNEDPATLLATFEFLTGAQPHSAIDTIGIGVSEPYEPAG